MHLNSNDCCEICIVKNVIIDKKIVGENVLANYVSSGGYFVSEYNSSLPLMRG